MFKRLKNLFSPRPQIVYELKKTSEDIINGYVHLTAPISGVVNDGLFLSDVANMLIPQESGTIALMSGVLNIQRTRKSVERIAEGKTKFIQDPSGGENNATLSMLVLGDSSDRKQLFREMFINYFQGSSTFVGLLSLAKDEHIDQTTLTEISGLLQRIADLTYNSNEKLQVFQEKVKRNFEEYFSDQRLVSFLSAGSDEHYLWFYMKNTSSEKLRKIFESVAENYGLRISG